MTDYRSDGTSDARDFIDHYTDEIAAALVDYDKASDDLFNDYDNGDSWVHENVTDRNYSLTDAAELLDQLSRWEETDSGLWHGLEPRRAIAAQAAYTYSAYVCSEIADLIRMINDDYEAALDDVKRDESLDEDASDEKFEGDKRQLATDIVRKAAKGEP
jgi:hypothetical protein